MLMFFFFLFAGANDLGLSAYVFTNSIKFAFSCMYRSAPVKFMFNEVFFQRERGFSHCHKKLEFTVKIRENENGAVNISFSGWKTG